MNLDLYCAEFGNSLIDGEHTKGTTKLPNEHGGGAVGWKLISTSWISPSISKTNAGGVDLSVALY